MRMSNHYSCLSTLGGLGASIVDGQSLTGIKNRVGRTSFLVGQKYGRNNNSVIFVSAKLTNLSGNSVDLEVVLAMWNKLSKKTGNRKRKVYPLIFSGTRNNITGCHLRNSNLIAESNEELCRNIKGMEWDAVGKKCKYKFLPTDPSKASRGFSSLGVVQDCDPMWTPDHRNWCGGETVRQSNGCGGTRDGMGTKPSKWSPERGLYCDDATFTQTEGCCRGYSNCLKDTRAVSGSNITPFTPEKSLFCSGVSFTQTRPCCATGVTNTNNCRSSRTVQGTANPPWSPLPSTKCRGVSFTQSRACCNTPGATPPCTSTRTAVGTKCCTSCGADFTLDSNSCTCECTKTCPSNYAVDTNTCTCKSTCNKTCPTHYSLDLNTCTCKSTCTKTCPSSHDLDLATCSCKCNKTCHDPWSLDSSTCSCKCNKTNNDCATFAGYTMNKTTCQCELTCTKNANECSVNKRLDRELCACVDKCPGMTCPASKYLHHASCTCKCRPGTIWDSVSNKCKCNKPCKSGQVLDLTSCQCGCITGGYPLTRGNWVKNNSSSGCGSRRRCFNYGDRPNYDFGPCSSANNPCTTLFWGKCLIHAQCETDHLKCKHGTPVKHPDLPSNMWLCSHQYPDGTVHGTLAFPMLNTSGSSPSSNPRGILCPHPSNFTGKSYRFQIGACESNSTCKNCNKICSGGQYLDAATCACKTP